MIQQHRDWGLEVALPKCPCANVPLCPCAPGVNEKIFNAMSKAIFGIESVNFAINHWWLDPNKRENLTESDSQVNLGKSRIFLTP